MLKSLIWPIATYGCESWTIKKEDDDRIKAFEMKGLRRILRIPWTARKTNEWILETTNVNRSLLESIKSRKLKYYGHVLRNKEEPLEKDIIQGTMPGRQARGRPRMVPMDNIKVWTGLSHGVNFCEKTRFRIPAKRVNADRFNAFHICHTKRMETFTSSQRFASFFPENMKCVKPVSINAFLDFHNKHCEILSNKFRFTAFVSADEKRIFLQ